MILQQALEQLDPHQLGMAIIIVQCMPPWDNQKIYSLRERAGHGTRPWSMNLEQHAIFLGEESLAGNIVTTVAPKHSRTAMSIRALFQLIGSNGKRVRLVTLSYAPAKLPVACLYLPRNLTISPAQRVQLIQSYAELLAFVLEPHEFYDIIPDHLTHNALLTEQRKKLATFRIRVAGLIAQSLKDKIPMNLTQAEQIVWQQIEKELLFHTEIINHRCHQTPLNEIL